MAPASPADLLDRLKTQTRSEHLAMEDALGLMRDDLLLVEYRRLLELYFGFYAPVEARLAEALPATLFGGLGFEPRRKLPLLQADLRALGGRATRTLAVCNALPSLRTPAQAMGCLYVLEGATLGGMVIGAHIRRTLGLTPATGTAFFHGSGARTVDLWRTFRAALTDFAADAALADARAERPADVTADAVVDSANDTFRSLRHWCVSGRTA